MRGGMRDPIDSSTGNITDAELNDAMAQRCDNCKKWKLWSCFYLSQYGYDPVCDGWCAKWKDKGK
jgi:hypothetical protein